MTNPRGSPQARLHRVLKGLHSLLINKYKRRKCWNKAHTFPIVDRTGLISLACEQIEEYTEGTEYCAGANELLYQTRKNESVGQQVEFWTVSNGLGAEN